MGFGVMAASRAAPKLVDRAGVGRVAPAGLVTLAAGMGVLSRLAPGSSFLLVLGGVLLAGAGIGIATTPATTAIVDGLPRAKQGVASALNNLSRELGAALGIAVIGSLQADRYAARVATHTAGLPASAAAAVRTSVGAATEVAQALPHGAALADAARASFVDGLSLALSVAAIAVLATAIVVARLLRHAPRRASEHREARVGGDRAASPTG
jgi:fucose permease